MDADVLPAIGVLVVDDQALFRQAVRTVVGRTVGFHVVGEAEDGVEAIAQVGALRPGLVLMDIHMPNLDGIEATRRIMDEVPSTVVVLLSSYDRDDLPGRVLDSRAAAYLHKEELDTTTLRRVWDEHRA